MSNKERLGGASQTSPEKSPLKKLRALTNLQSLRKQPVYRAFPPVAGGSKPNHIGNDGGIRKATAEAVEKRKSNNYGMMESNKSKIKPPSTLKYKAKSHIKCDSPTYDMLSKPVYSSNLFKDIPVRQRKGVVPHLENYCLFDPSVDFFNEKEHILRSIPETKVLEFIDPPPPPPPPLIYDTLEEIDEAEEFLFESSSSDSTTSTGTNKLQKSISSSAIDRRSTSSSSTSSYYGVIAVRKQPLVSTTTPSTSLPNSPGMYHRTRKLHQNHVVATPKFPLKPSSSLPQLYGDRFKHLRRPLSNYSADSGFLSPQSPTQKCVTFDETQELIQIYTEWANYYLERSKSKKRVVEISVDCRDGLLLAEVIEAVTSFKVPDLVKKPKTQQQMFDNVDSCLNLLRRHQIEGLESISAYDICAGRLKAVLAVFFTLSRYKQATKQRTASRKNEMPVASNPSSVHQGNYPIQQPEMTRTLPAPYSKTNGSNGGTAIPLPATVLVQRRCPPDKVRPLPPTPNHQTAVPGTKQNGGTSSETSRPSSPPSSGSQIPKGGGGNSLRQPACKIPASPYANGGQSTQGTTTAVVTAAAAPTTTKHSMLDKLRLFNKEKSSKSQISKRTSSSSGFSSARSERSDSSVSLNEAQQTGKRLDDTKKSDTANSAKSKSKLLSSKPKDKKDKSKDKKNAVEHYQDSNITIVDSKIVPPKTASSKGKEVKGDTKLKPPLKKLEAKSESRTSLSSISSNSKPLAPGTTSIPKPMAAIKGTTKPIEKQSENNNFEKPINGNVDSQSSHSGHHSNSSESSIIYRPSSESSCSDIMHTNIVINMQQQKNNSIPNRSKIDSYDQMSESNSNKYNTVPSKLVNATIYEEEKQQPAVLPMRPLLRGYNSHVTLPTRGTRGGQLVSEYCEDANGYSSDGDALRKLPVRFSDCTENGYMSEGGTPTKHYLSVIRARTQLPTTIAEERCRSSHDKNLDSVGTNPQSMENNKTSSPRNGREFWGKLPEPQNGVQQSNPSSPTSSRKDSSGKCSPNHSRRASTATSTPTTKSVGRSSSKGVSPSFGYIKRTNGTGTELLTGGRTAHVSAVPRTNKLKVSGGTQTATQDFQSKMGQHQQYRSFSLTGPGAAQLSQSVKERFGSGTHSLPKPGLDMHVYRMSNRASAKLTDGSLSDTQTYAEVKPDYSTYAMWLKHSSTATSRLSDGDSIEPLSIGSPGMSRNFKLLQQQQQLANATHASQSPRLNRSNSIRSTKSEKMYPSMLSRGPDVDIEPYYCLPVGTMQTATAIPWSQPTSPTPPTRTIGSILSPTHGHPRIGYPKKNDEVHGSQASLLSGGSSMYGSTEDRPALEVRRLKRELADAREQIMSLSSQLSTNAHVVSAFEQSLSNMTSRLHQLTATTEKKESEILDMRQTIELLRKQSIQAGLTTAHMQSMGVPVNGQKPLQVQQQQQQQHQNHHQPQQQKHQKADTLPPLPPPNNGMQRHHSSDSMCSLNSISSGCSSQDKKKKKGWLRSSFTKAFSRNAKITKTNRHVSQASNLDSIAQSPQSQHGDDVVLNHQNQNSPKHSPHKTVTLVENAKPIDAVDMDGNPIVQDLKKQLREKDLVLTDIRLEALSSASQLESLKDTVMKMRQEMINLKQNNERLQRLVTSRSLAGSEASLGGRAAVSPSGSAGESSRRFSLATDNGGANSYTRPVNTSAIEEMLETQLNEMLSILQPLELPKNLDETEEDNIPPAPAPDPPLSVSPMTALSPTLDRRLGEDILTTPAEEVADPVDGKKISIVVYLGQPGSFPKYAEELSECDSYDRYEDDEVKDQNLASKCPVVEPSSLNNEFVIAFTYISGKTTWQNLDYIVRKTFKDYLARIDPGGNLGLNTDSITSYHLGDAKRGPEMGYPELLPCGYIVGHVKSLYICLQGVGSLAFDTLIPRSIVHRYITLLTEHRRLILCGPSGTGKSYLARKLAEFLVAKSGKENPTEAIATFNVDHKSSKELQQYLSHIAEQASMSDGVSEELPSVIILDNLHHASELGDVFSCLLSAGPAAKLPCIIGTMSQATCNTTNLQLHHNFRWVLTANHMEPVKGFLARFLRRRLFTLELTTGRVQVTLEKVLRWLPTVWAHINGFLETHSSSDVTIGPRLFLACPLDMTDSQVWFTDVWNYHLAPYVMEAVREGVQLYGRRGATWTDPCTFVRETYPWPVGPSNVPTLRQITAEDVGLEQDVSGSSENQDPLLNMLMRLQEAANYNGNQEQDSDCASLDSNLTHDSSAGVD